MMWWWAVLLAATAQAAEVRPVTATERVPGIAAAARPGDLLLQADGGARFVVTALEHRVGMQASGGNLVDVWIDGGEDVFDGFSPWFARDYPRSARWTALEPLADGVRVTGVDTDDAALRVEQELRLVPDALPGHLRIATTVTNTSGSPRPGHHLGDIVGWGGLQHFAPGPGFALKGKDELLPWVGGQGPGVAAILVSAAPLTGPHGASWSDPVWETVDLPAGGSATYVRHLLVGRSLTDLLATAHAIRGEDAHPARVVVQEAGGGPIAGAQVVLRGDAGPAAVGITDAEGALEASLLPGSYRVAATAPGRRLVQAEQLVVPIAPDAAVQLSRPGRVKLVATDGRNRPMPARFTFQNLDGDDPVLGPPSRAIGGNRVNLAAPEQVLIPPGRYLVTVSRGPAWSLQSREFTVSPVKAGDTPPELRASLQRQVARNGWLQCDLHTHAAPSFDSAIPLEDGLIAAAAEGVDCLATTDHDATADFTEALKSTGLLGHILWLPGLEITSEEGAGHINAYPWNPELGAWDHAGQTADDLVRGLRQTAPGAALQLNHPLWKDIGLWASVGLDPATGLPRESKDGEPTGLTWDFDAVEVLNGTHVAGFTPVVEAWQRTLDAGHRSVAVGNSDSHRIVGQERGSARTWIRVGEDRSSGAVVRALRGEGEVVASNAPLVRVEVEPGDPARLTVTAWAAEWVPLKHLELHAGDPTGIGGWIPRRWEAGDPAITEVVAQGQRRWTVVVDLPLEALDGWVLAVARGERNMWPWLEVPAYGLSNPVWLEE